MIKVTINGKKEFFVEGTSLNENQLDWDMIEVRDNTFHIIKNGKNYNATLISFNSEEKTMVITVNNSDYEISIKDKYDLLLQQLGINSTSSSFIQSVKAPMPGLIINVSVGAGDEVKKGDTLLILEAMKMENAIKSPRDGKIKQVNVVLQQPVEKNQVMVEFK